MANYNRLFQQKYSTITETKNPEKYFTLSQIFSAPKGLRR